MSAANFQIVNGGQTTASIHAARKNAPEQLKDVFVQMKLTVVPPGSPEEIVPSISRFANSQNKVNAADFFANHPFHIRMQEFSRRVLSPAGDSRYRETKWFYEGPGAVRRREVSAHPGRTEKVRGTIPEGTVLYEG
jgi:hypothetical protein